MIVACKPTYYPMSDTHTHTHRYIYTPREAFVFGQHTRKKEIERRIMSVKGRVGKGACIACFFTGPPRMREETFFCLVATL
jgi:hypothetical protein